jgi:hypothetical protein
MSQLQKPNTLFTIPFRASNLIEILQRDFLWGGLNNKLKFHLVNWKKVCTPLYLGVLGVRSLLTSKKAMLGKWLWRFVVEERPSGDRSLIKKYGSLIGGWCSKVVLGLMGRVFGTILGGARIFSVGLLLSRWVMDLGPGFGMTLGLGIIL